MRQKRERDVTTNKISSVDIDILSTFLLLKFAAQAPSRSWGGIKTQTHWDAFHFGPLTYLGRKKAIGVIRNAKQARVAKSTKIRLRRKRTWFWKSACKKSSKNVFSYTISKRILGSRGQVPMSTAWSRATPASCSLLTAETKPGSLLSV